MGTTPDNMKEAQRLLFFLSLLLIPCYGEETGKIAILASIAMLKIRNLRSQKNDLPLKERKDSPCEVAKDILLLSLLVACVSRHPWLTLSKVRLLKGWLWSHVHAGHRGYGPLTSLPTLLVSTARA